MLSSLGTAMGLPRDLADEEEEEEHELRGGQDREVQSNLGVQVDRRATESACSCTQTAGSSAR